MSESIIQELIRLEIIKPYMVRYAHMVMELMRISEPGLELYSDYGAITCVAERFDVDKGTVERAMQNVPHRHAVVLSVGMGDNTTIEIQNVLKAQGDVMQEIATLQTGITLDEETGGYARTKRKQLSEHRKALARLYRNETYLRGKT